jgi:hypothetical protein
MNAKLNDTKKRVNKELGSNHCWISLGREVENYLSESTISKWLLELHDYKSNFINDKNTKLEENIIKSNRDIKIKYNLTKNLYSAEIVKFIDRDSINTLDLKSNMDRLIAVIKEWNK